MGDTPTTNNKAAEFVNNVIEALFEGGMEAAIVYITGVAPEAMAVPIVSWAVREALSYVEHIVSVAGQQLATKIVIDLQTNGEKSRVLNSGVALQLALGSGNQEAIKGAADTLRSAYASLIHYDGSAQPK